MRWKQAFVDVSTLVLCDDSTNDRARHNCVNKRNPTPHCDWPTHSIHTHTASTHSHTYTMWERRKQHKAVPRRRIMARPPGHSQRRVATLGHRTETGGSTVKPGDAGCHRAGTDATGAELGTKDPDGSVAQEDASLFAAHDDVLSTQGSTKASALEQANKFGTGRVRSREWTWSRRDRYDHTDEHKGNAVATAAAIAPSPSPHGTTAAGAHGGLAPLDSAAGIEQRQPLPVINDVAAGRGCTGEHCANNERDRGRGRGDGGGDDDKARRRRAAKRARRVAWNKYHGAGVCFALKAVLWRRIHPALVALDPYFPVSPAQMLHALRYLSLFHTRFDTALAEWPTLDGGAALRLVELGMHITHAAQAARLGNYASLGPKQVFAHDNLALWMRATLGHHLPLILAEDWEVDEHMENAARGGTGAGAGEDEGTKTGAGAGAGAWNAWFR